MQVICQGYDISQSAVIICVHCAKQGYPILAACRDEPEDPADTGWQFHCNMFDHSNDPNGQVWSAGEVANHDSSVLSVIDNPVGAKFTRNTALEPWCSTPQEA
jgi:hypothetical protein